MELFAVKQELTELVMDDLSLNASLKEDTTEFVTEASNSHV